MKKTRLSKLWSERHLPEELWPEILSRLPAETLARYRSVSKSWRELIDDPVFSRLHIARFNTNLPETRLLVVQGSIPRKYAIRCIKSLKLTAPLRFLQRGFPTLESWFVVSYIDGLFILKNKDSELILWNPSLRKTRILPPSPEIFNEIAWLNFGMGFDPMTKDYKHVRFVWLLTEGLRFVSVYSLRTNSWKTIEFQGKGCSSWRQTLTFAQNHTILCWRGVLCGLARNRDSGPFELVTYNLSNEIFASIKLPVEENPALGNGWLALADFEGSVTVVNYSSPNGSIWVLEGILQTDVGSWSWSKLYTFATMIPEYDSPAGVCRFLYLGTSGEMLLKGEDCDEKGVQRVSGMVLHGELGSSLSRSICHVYFQWFYIQT